MLLALEICSYFYSEVGGYFFAAYDTGDSLFSVGDKGLLLSSDFRGYYSAYPMPIDTYAFVDLPSP